jgi:hypothetical protein
LLVIGGTSTVDATAAPRFPAPPGCRVGLVGEEMIYNGIPMNIRQLKCSSPAEDVLDYYREHWPRGTEDEPGYVESEELPPWTILTRVDGGFLMTVQVTDEGRGAAGYLAMSELPEDPDDLPELGEGFPTLRETQIYNDVKTRDVGKRGRTLQMSNRHSRESNVIFYRNFYRDRGWTVLLDKELGGQITNLAFKNGDESVNLVVTQGEGGSIITVQLIEESWW